MEQPTDRGPDDGPKAAPISQQWRHHEQLCGCFERMAAIFREIQFSAPNSGTVMHPRVQSNRPPTSEGDGEARLATS